MILGTTVGSKDGDAVGGLVSIIDGIQEDPVDGSIVGPSLGS